MSIDNNLFGIYLLEKEVISPENLLTAIEMAPHITLELDDQEIIDIYSVITSIEQPSTQKTSNSELSKKDKDVLCLSESMVSQGFLIRSDLKDLLEEYCSSYALSENVFETIITVSEKEKYANILFELFKDKFSEVAKLDIQEMYSNDDRKCLSQYLSVLTRFTGDLDCECIISYPQNLAEEITLRAWGKELGQEDKIILMIDALAEISNVIFGNAMILLGDEGVNCQIMVPKIYKGFEGIYYELPSQQYDMKDLYMRKISIHEGSCFNFCVII